MVQNAPCWRVSYALELPKLLKSKSQAWPVEVAARSLLPSVADIVPRDRLLQRAIPVSEELGQTLFSKKIVTKSCYGTDLAIRLLAVCFSLEM